MARIEDDQERQVCLSCHGCLHLKTGQRLCKLVCLQATFQRRKNGLMRRAMELSVLCGCDIAMFMFAPNDRLLQYTSSDMEGLLNKYSQRCQEAHETRTNQDVRLQYFVTAITPVYRNLSAFADGLCCTMQLLQMLPPDLAADVVALHPSRHTHRVWHALSAVSKLQCTCT